MPAFRWSSSRGAPSSGTAGALIARVVDTKAFPDGRRFAVLDAGMGELMRPAMYGVVPPDRPGGPRAGAETPWDVVGPDLREQRRLRPRSPAAAARGGRPRRAARHRRLRRGDGLQLQPPPAAAGGAGGRRRVAGHPAPADARRRPGARVMPRQARSARAADCVRRSRSERQTDAGRAPARAAVAHAGRTVRLAVVSRLRDADRDGDRAARCTASATTAPTSCSCSTWPTATNGSRRSTDALAAGTVVVCDRYLASSVAYGEAHGLDAGVAAGLQSHLPQPDLTFLLDIPPDASVSRKTTDRDKYERDLALLARVRESYLRQARDGWVRLDADRRPRRRVRRRVRGRHGAPRIAALAAVTARTSRAPACFKTCAHASSVAPVVRTSSTRSTTRPTTSDDRPPLRTRGESPNERRTFRRRAPAVRPDCAAVCRTRRRAWTTGSPSCSARSAAWLKPRRSRRHGWSGTGTAQSAPWTITAPACRINAPRGRASERRPSNLNACTISLSAPSYSPAAMPASIAGGLRRHRAHCCTATLRTRHEGRGSPQVRQCGGGTERTAAQQGAQTGPSSGASSARAQAAHGGATSTATTASAACLRSARKPPVPLGRARRRCVSRRVRRRRIRGARRCPRVVRGCRTPCIRG